MREKKPEGGICRERWSWRDGGSCGWRGSWRAREGGEGAEGREGAVGS